MLESGRRRLIETLRQAEHLLAAAHFDQLNGTTGVECLQDALPNLPEYHGLLLQVANYQATSETVLEQVEQAIQYDARLNSNLLNLLRSVEEFTATILTKENAVQTTLERINSKQDYLWNLLVFLQLALRNRSYYPPAASTGFLFRALHVIQRVRAGVILPSRAVN